MFVVAGPAARLLVPERRDWQIDQSVPICEICGPDLPEWSLLDEEFSSTDFADSHRFQEPDSGGRWDEGAWGHRRSIEFKILLGHTDWNGLRCRRTRLLTHSRVIIPAIPSIVID